MATRQNVVELAHANRENLNGRYWEACERLEVGGMQAELDDFHDKIENWTVSMNMGDDDLIMFLEKGYHRNVVNKSSDAFASYKWLGGDLTEVPSLNESMAQNDPFWYPKRLVYREIIENEEDFKYGALYVSGDALMKYGHYAVILDKKAVQEYSKMILLKRDSLDYLNASNGFDFDSYSMDLASVDNAYELAVLKHEADLYSSCGAALSKLCYAESNEDRSYLEVQIEDEVSMKHIGRIIIQRKLNEYLLEVHKKRLKRRFDFGKQEEKDEYALWGKFQLLFGKMSILGLKFEQSV